MHNETVENFSLLRVQRLYGKYLEQVEQLEKNRKWGDGLFGLKGGPEDDPCHDRFVEDLEKLLENIRLREPDPEQVCQVLRYLYEAPLGHSQPKSIYWMLLAVHSLTPGLIERLSAENARSLYDWYEAAFPRRERLPAQNKVLKALKAAGRNGS